MMRTSLKNSDWNLGRITVLSERPSSDTRVTVTDCVWRPDAFLADSFPKDFMLPIRQIMMPRHQGIAPAADPFEFLVLAFAGGVSLLEHLKLLPESQVLDARGLLVMFQRMWHAREFQGRKFTRLSDLSAKTQGRTSGRGILPDEIGVDTCGQDSSWTIGELARRGKELAGERKLTRCSQADQIRLGFFAAAQGNPLHLKLKEVPPLVRLGLFATGPSLERPPTSLSEMVHEQIRVAIGDRLDRTSGFERLILDKKSDLIHRIAKRKDIANAREQVRQIILELGWQAFLLGGLCIEAQMRAVAAALPNPLNGWSKRAHELKYYRQRQLGDLPLIILQNRFD